MAEPSEERVETSPPAAAGPDGRSDSLPTMSAEARGGPSERVADGDGPDADRRLSRNVYVVSAVSFLQDTASELLYPVLPVFVTKVLGAPPAVLGLIEGVAEGTAASMKAASGRLADLRHRRPLVATGYGVSALGKLILALAFTWPVVLLARFTDRTGKGLRGPPRDAIIADETTPANRGRAFGFHRAADTAGAVVGPLLGLGLLALVGEEHLRTLFLVAVIPAVASAAFVFFIREKPHPGIGAKERRWSFGGLTPRYWRLLTILGLFSLVNFPDALLLLRAGDLGLGTSQVIVVYVLYNLSYAVLSYPAGTLSDRLDRRRIFVVGMVAFSVAYLGFGLTDTSAWVWLLLPVYGCYTALTDGISRAWVADLVPASERGTALGLHAAITGVGFLIAGVWAGLAWSVTGRVPFLVSGSVVLVLAVVLATVGRSIDGPDEDAVSPTP